MTNSPASEMKVTRLAVAGGIDVELLNYGATLKSIRVPVAGEMVDVLLKYDDHKDYLRGKDYLGATLGRVAGRIGSGAANINGEDVSLSQNETIYGHCLHGGASGFSHQYWRQLEQTDHSVAYEYVSPDGDQGFPGCLKTRVAYRLCAPTTLQIDFSAETDKETLVNLSNHAYFNLNKHERSIANHELQINADLYTPVDAATLPTGEVLGVEGTVFDFRHATSLAERLHEKDAQLLLAGGYDHYFLLKPEVQAQTVAVILHSPESGITMKMFSDQSGVILYSGNWLAAPFLAREALCLEFQQIPNAPHLPWFGSTVLLPGETYRRQIRLQFET